MSPELTKQWLELASQVPDCGLYDQELQDVDPFDEELDVGMQIRIWEEAKRNPRYFFMRILKVGPFVVDSLDKMAMGMFPGRWTAMSEDSVLKPIVVEAIAKEVGKDVEAAITKAFTPAIKIPVSLRGEEELTAVIKDMGKDQAAEALIAIGKANPDITPWGKLPGARGDNLPDVPELELLTIEVVVDPALQEKLDTSLLEVRGRAMGEAPPGWQKPHALLRPSDIKGFPEPEPLREIPDEPLERAKIAAELWQEIVEDGELGRTNDQVEYLFTKRVRELYGNEFLRVKINGLTVTVQHLVWGKWETL